MIKNSHKGPQKINTSAKRALLFLFLLIFPFVLSPYNADPEEDSAQFYWWRVSIKITVTGDYSYKNNGIGFQGDYDFSISIVGTIHQDEGDYIFVEVWQETDIDKWDETLTNDGNNSVTDLKKFYKPEAMVNYIFTQRGKLFFDLDVKEIRVPHKSSLYPESIKKLQIPLSSGESFTSYKTRYAKGIVSGSNKLELTQAEIFSNREIKHTYSWKWEQREINSLWQNQHQVTVEVKVNRESGATTANPI